MGAKQTMEIIFKILEKLEEAMDKDHFDWKNEISHEAIGITKNRWILIIDMMNNNGLIEGLSINRGAQGDITIVTAQPRITLKGINFLIENSQTAKVIEAAKLIKDFIPGY
ncbi:YjcQ family protein [Natranaerofaba carboxydovora]|uniref:YjcQ family protein n=1 Tax=Natranaerofaba carboxydovora TaxID=2742683 RepID=UPI001F14897C|nr:YjcQ family protein [Natranaerofaba carboxydovora]UMZ73548.1 YjcQ protein [Natranaerofaba carboxydovora]